MKPVVAALGILTSLSIGAAGSARAAIKVACVGDSITLGARSSTPAKTYPSQLGALLGAGYDVQNFGAGGATLLRRGDFPYWNQPAYGLSTAFAANVVVIMLGTNDAKAPNWALRAGFETDYRALIDHYAQLPRHPKIYVALPTPTFGTNAYGIQPTVLAREVIPAIKRVATAAAVPVIDVNTALANARTDFADLVHPNDAGNAKIAMTVWAALRDKPEPPDAGSSIDTAVVDAEVKPRDVAAPDLPDPPSGTGGVSGATATGGAGGQTPVTPAGSGGQRGSGGAGGVDARLSGTLLPVERGGCAMTHGAQPASFFWLLGPSLLLAGRRYRRATTRSAKSNAAVSPGDSMPSR